MAAHPARARLIDARVVVLSVLLVVALLAWFGVDYLKDRLAGNGCDTTTPVRITAAPDVAPVLTTLARTVPARDCYSVEVTASASTATAAALEANGANGPDVWVPESSTWLPQARDAGAWNLPESGQSVASSPVVLALTDEVARQVGWPGKSPSWSDVLAGHPVGLPDPGRDPAGIAALIGLRQLTKDAPDPAAAFTEKIRELSAVKEPFTASPASEQSVLARKLVAAYPAADVPGFDYPYVVLPRASETSRSAAERFLRLLLDQTATKAFADAGFRTPAGQLLSDRAPDTRTNSAPRPAGPPAPELMYGVLQAWAGANLSARQSWKLGRINVVVVLTDGRNEDSDSIGLPGLLTELGKLQDPRKPLPVIGIGIGPDIDAAELRQVSAATGGESFTTPDPRKISDVFYQALSKLMCQPPACKN
jgi:ABC-type molybdate transport system substrate-binding protein